MVCSYTSFCVPSFLLNTSTLILRMYVYWCINKQQVDLLDYQSLSSTYIHNFYHWPSHSKHWRTFNSKISYWQPSSITLSTACEYEIQEFSWFLNIKCTESFITQPMRHIHQYSFWYNRFLYIHTHINSTICIDQQYPLYYNKISDMKYQQVCISRRGKDVIFPLLWVMEGHSLTVNIINVITRSHILLTSCYPSTT